MEQIEALISVSEYCEQEVINNCTSNQLTGYAWWLDRSGDRYQYWHGEGNQTDLGSSSYFQISLSEIVDWSLRINFEIRKRLSMLAHQFMRLCFQ